MHKPSCCRPYPSRLGKNLGGINNYPKIIRMVDKLRKKRIIDKLKAHPRCELIVYEVSADTIVPHDINPIMASINTGSRVYVIF